MSLCRYFCRKIEIINITYTDIYTENDNSDMATNKKTICSASMPRV